ncbi:MAG: helix-turn-helix domain-containing protein [Myxococcota bacterium]
MDERLYLPLEGDPVLASAASVPGGTLRGFRVCRALARNVAQIDVFREAAPDVAFERVVPDGAVRLIFDLGTKGGRADVAGPSARPVRLPLQGKLANLTVTLRPGAASELLGAPARVIRDQCVPLAELWPGEVEPLAERLLAAPTDAQRSAIVQSALASRLARRGPSERTRAMRARQVLASGGTVREAAEDLGISERRLQQIFDAEVGLSPRQVRRISRMHACLRSLRHNPRPRWPEVALEHGFVDQAHCSNEFRALVGLAPTACVALISGSSKTRH